MNLLVSLIVGWAVFQSVWWLGTIWVTGAEVLDEHSE